jgi:hypothetical protein
MFHNTGPCFGSKTFGKIAPLLLFCFFSKHDNIGTYFCSNTRQVAQPILGLSKLLCSLYIFNVKSEQVSFYPEYAAPFSIIFSDYFCSNTRQVVLGLSRLLCSLYIFNIKSEQASFYPEYAVPYNIMFCTLLQCFSNLFKKRALRFQL